MCAVVALSVALRATILREARRKKQERKRIAESYEIRRKGEYKGRERGKGRNIRRASARGKVTRNRIYWRRRGSAGEFFRVSELRPPLPFDSPVNHDSSRGISQNGAATARRYRAGLGVEALVGSPGCQVTRANLSGRN